MTKSAYFSVDTRLTALLGETYRSTEAALKELVDNAWDAGADNVWITLPAPMSNEPIVIRDDGSGMTPLDVAKEYLTIARDRRSKKGQRSPKYKRRIKGRKGIGKFAGLAAAQKMLISTCAAGVRSTVSIDKQVLPEANKDLETDPTPGRRSAGKRK
ncbi:ATP-binding protein [Hyphomicrobium facile]|uniref:ATP-binding protein n=1 Tax=Hyphomicrobium facile TaxID=51670 RepID=UPI000AB5DC61|nr:ATP-binding protein [Hyphomicrobium facile]